LNIIEAVTDKNLLGSMFKDPSTWAAWRVFLRGLFNIPITDAPDLELFKRCTGLDEPPAQAVRECAAICGRRSGKSFVSAITSVFLACFKDWQPYLSPGERGMIFIIAVDREQAKIIKNYVGGILNSSKILSGMIEQERQEQIDLKNRVSIAIKTCNYRSVRGYTVLCAILEETAFWRSEESANPDVEVLTALRPALAGVPGSLLIAISTPYSRAGILYDMFKRHYGQAGKSTLVWKAPSLTMNPTLNRGLIDAAITDDPEAGRAEWEAEWRLDISAFLSGEMVTACVVPGRTDLPPVGGIQYYGHTDPSGGSKDSFTLAIAHKEKSGLKVLDLVRERKPPFNPREVVSEFSTILKAFRVSEVGSDRYAGEWVVAGFSECNIRIKHSELSASELYLELLPIISSRAVELLDSKRLISQLAGLERRTRSGGKDLVTHYPGGHDDCAVSAAGAILAAAGVGAGPQPFIWRAFPDWPVWPGRKIN